MKASSGKNIRSVLAALLMTAALVGMACGTSARPAPGTATAVPTPTATTKPTLAPRVEEKTLRVGLPFLFTNQPADPAKGGGFQLIANGLAETLFKLAKDLRPEPWLATGARQLDEKTWEISLRQGVKFHNGALMDAAAVRASLERAVAKSPSAKAVLDIARIEVKDPVTLIIVTNGPSAILPGLLTEPTTAIVDAGAAEAKGDAFSEKPVLTGPFKVERFQQDNELLAVRHREYWGPPPSVDRVIFRYLPDNQSRVLALQSGDIDIASYIAAESVSTVRSVSNLTVVSAAPLALDFMLLNHRREPLKDVRVRQAIALAIDRDALVKAVMQGQAVTAIGPLPPTVLRCNELRGHPFDPAKAKQLLSEAGYQDKDGDGVVEKDGQPFAMTLLTYRQRPELPPMAEAIQASLKTIGVKVDVRMVEQINTALQQANWDGGMYYNEIGIATGDRHWQFSQYFSTGGSGNRGGYSNPRVDELIRQMGQATDLQERDRLACAVAQVVVDEAAMVLLLFPNFNYGLSRKVIGFDEPHPHSMYFIDSKIGKR